MLQLEFIIPENETQSELREGYVAKLQLILINHIERT
jgi:hypothetical protein